MTEPIKSDQSQYASSPYLNAYIQKQRLAQASSDLPTSRSRGAARVYETRRLERPQRGQAKGVSAASDWSKDHTNGEIYQEDRPIDRLHQFEIERGITQEAQEGDKNPYDDSSDDTPDLSIK